MFINHFWAAETTSSELGIQALEQELLKSESLPSCVYIVSAGEVNVLLDPVVRSFVAKLERKGFNVRFVGAACTSVHAAMLAFLDSNEKRSLICVLELNQALQQACLNAIGIGNEVEQDGLEVKTGVGLLDVSLKAGDNAIEVFDLNLWAQESGVRSAQVMLMKMRKYFQLLPIDSRIVSFDICSQWCKSLLEGLNTKSWLPSYEQDHNHVLSLKPIFELQQYYDYLDSGPLVLVTLGGGGRIGCLIVKKHKRKGRVVTRFKRNITHFNFELEENYQQFKSVMMSESTPALIYQKTKAAMKYPSVIYRGIENHYFEWLLTETSWRELDVKQQAVQNNLRQLEAVS
ncbi:hypothetical protein [Pleionea sp. CnH1-48]|uniref:hypothetical protein n=1 Tax=Pleionea sp. CnH1-48 TaxID=2954494 RepID=UPI002097D3E4|nr:hypothetical protein [Pleionea sp. CnH1-48]MCO7225536.1 hypothetical protein [Pleionea sp. CnH1-48]